MRYSIVIASSLADADAVAADKNSSSALDYIPACSDSKDSFRCHAVNERKLNKEKNEKEKNSLRFEAHDTRRERTFFPSISCHHYSVANKWNEMNFVVLVHFSWFFFLRWLFCFSHFRFVWLFYAVLFSIILSDEEEKWRKRNNFFRAFNPLSNFLPMPMFVLLLFDDVKCKLLNFIFSPAFCLTFFSSIFLMFCRVFVSFCSMLPFRKLNFAPISFHVIDTLRHIH